MVKCGAFPRCKFLYFHHSGYNNYIIKNGFIETATPALWTWLFFSSPKLKGYAYDVIPPLFPDHLPTFFLHGCRLAMAG
jgi:hypothetical protein